MKPKTYFITLTLLVITSLSFARMPANNQVNLNTAVSHPYLLFSQQQTAYLRIGLEGCKVENFNRPPVNIAIVIDKSGSMGGEKIEHAKNAAISAINRLNHNDILSVITYDNVATVVVPATKVSDKEMIFQKIRNINASGSTALHDGVCKGASELRKFKDKNHANRIILLSDGLANVGPQTPEELGRLGGNLIKENISVTTIGLGLGYSEDLMSKLAFKSDGGHYFVEHAENLAKVFDEEFGMTLAIVAQEINIQINCADGVRPVRLLGREGKINGQDVTVNINQLYGGHEKYVILEVEVKTPELRSNVNKQLTGVKVSYHNMITGKNIPIKNSPHIILTDSQARVEKAVNSRVMVDVVEQIANERNELAVTMRDNGQIEKAKVLLFENTVFLNSNAAQYDSDKLYKFEKENKDDAANLEGPGWNKQRKSMRSRQSSSRTQNTNK